LHKDQGDVFITNRKEKKSEKYTRVFEAISGCWRREESATRLALQTSKKGEGQQRWIRKLGIALRHCAGESDRLHRDTLQPLLAGKGYWQKKSLTEPLEKLGVQSTIPVNFLSKTRREDVAKGYDQNKKKGSN